MNGMVDHITDMIYDAWSQTNQLFTDYNPIKDNIMITNSNDPVFIDFGKEGWKFVPEGKGDEVKAMVRDVGNVYEKYLKTLFI